LISVKAEVRWQQYVWVNKPLMRLPKLIDTNTTAGEAVILLDREKARLLRLCRVLETMADGLPAAITKPQAIPVLKNTGTALRRHIALQELLIFPYIRDEQRGPNRVEGALRQLEYEHASDDALMIEIIEAVMMPGLPRSVPQIERFGCLLRHFFEGHRRHCAWETEVLGPLVRSLLPLRS
jgi:hemerythrin-like domain-containing protein